MSNFIFIYYVSFFILINLFLLVITIRLTKNDNPYRYVYCIYFCLVKILEMGSLIIPAIMMNNWSRQRIYNIKCVLFMAEKIVLFCLLFNIIFATDTVFENSNLVKLSFVLNYVSQVFYIISTTRYVRIKEAIMHENNVDQAVNLQD